MDRIRATVLLNEISTQLQRLRAQLEAARRHASEQSEGTSTGPSDLRTGEAHSAGRTVRKPASAWQSLDYEEMKSRLRRLACCLPREAVVAVVSRGDENLLSMGSRALHFPQMPDGTYAGYYPATSRDAIDHLEELRAKGAEYLVFPATALWWLEHYADFRGHLDSRYKTIESQPDTGIIYDICG